MKVRVGKGLKLSGALALMLTAGAGSAFATSLPTGTLNPLGTFDYNGLSYNPNTIITITNPPVGSATVYSTPITLTQTGGTYAGPYNAGFGTLITWCLDIFDDLQGSSAGPGPYTIYGPGWTSSGNANPVLTAAQINEIGLLMAEGDANLGNNAFVATVQEAIWSIEYSGSPFVFVPPNPGLAGLLAFAAANAGNPGDPTYAVDLLYNASNQELGFNNTSSNSLPTPLPAALPLFATGLGMMGLLGWRRRQRKADVSTAS